MTDTSTYADFSIKAICEQLEAVEHQLHALGARFEGEDLQVDTYFRVPVGKMKLREGTIEHLLTHYLREAWDGKMKTTVFLYERNPSQEIIAKHTGSLQGIGQVIKRRRIFFVDNIKFHLDRFENGGRFLEIEAIDREGTLGLDHIQAQAARYGELLGVRRSDVVEASYIDMQL